MYNFYFYSICLNLIKPIVFLTVIKLLLNIDFFLKSSYRPLENPERYVVNEVKKLGKDMEILIRNEYSLKHS